MIMIKSEAEIDKMREAGRIAGEILSEVGNNVAPGMTTKDLELIACKAMDERKVISAFKGYMGYPGWICVSVNDEVVHGIPGKRKLLDGDIVSIDVGIEKEGYYGDTAATYCVGQISPGKSLLLNTAKEALWQGIKYAVEGNHLGDISAAIQQYVEKKGFSVVRDYVGHGIGSAMHEDPAIPNFGRAGVGPELKTGMTLAIEPMVNAGSYSVKVKPDKWTVVTADGLSSVHFEHTIAVKKTEPEVFTCLKKNQ
ncbi:type I methionyl aminopeptidase [Chlamydiota bacterium]